MDEPSDSSEDVVITWEEAPRLTFDSALEATRDRSNRRWNHSLDAF